MPYNEMGKEFNKMQDSRIANLEEELKKEIRLRAHYQSLAETMAGCGFYDCVKHLWEKHLEDIKQLTL